MNIAGILERKGSAVETTAPDASLASAVHRLVALGIGALVVSSDGRRGRRDRLGTRDRPRAEPPRHDCARPQRRRRDGAVGAHVLPTDTVKHVMAEMTRTRHRHLPVVDQQGLCGLVSIGDVVKFRVDEAELETSVLRDAYLARR